MEDNDKPIYFKMLSNSGDVLIGVEADCCVPHMSGGFSLISKDPSTRVDIFPVSNGIAVICDKDPDFDSEYVDNLRTTMLQQNKQLFTISQPMNQDPFGTEELDNDNDPYTGYR